MESKQHTPGPWMWDDRDGRVSLMHPLRGHLVVMDFVRRGMHGGTCRFAVWEGPERGRMGGIMRSTAEIDIASHPDARLIAAAPDLLAALKELLGGIERTPCRCHEAYTGRGLTDPDCTRCDLDLTSGDIDAARAAIAKATGEAVAA